MKPIPIEFNRPGLLDAIKDVEAMGLWECLRRARATLTAAELARRSSYDISRVYAALDTLVFAGLVVAKKARGKRRTTGYTTSMNELSIVIDSRNPEHIKAANEVAAFINSELASRFFAARDKIGRTGPDTWHFHHCSPMALDREDLHELKRRVARVEEFVRLLGDKRSTRAGSPPTQCNHGMMIRIEPLDAPVLPQPHVEFISTVVVSERGIDPAISHQALTARERQVARALRDGHSRSEVGRRLAISEHTVGTLCKRIFRKLGIQRVAQLHGFEIG